MTKQSEGIKGTNRKIGDAILDEHTGAVVTITCEHAMIHESNAWKFSLIELAVAQNDSLLLQVQVGPRNMHLKNLRAWGDSAIAQFDVLEAPTLTTGAAPVSMENMNRADGAAAPAGVTMFSDPTVISGGTALIARLFGGGAGIGQTAFSETDRMDRELVLKASTRYLIRVTNLEANARNFSVDGFFYLEPE